MSEYLPLFALGTISLIAIAFLCWALHGYLKQDKPEQQKLIAFDATMRAIADAQTAPQSDDTQLVGAFDDTQEWEFDSSVLESEALPPAFEDYFNQLWQAQNTVNIENQLRWEWQLDKPDEGKE